MKCHWAILLACAALVVANTNDVASEEPAEVVPEGVSHDNSDAEIVHASEEVNHEQEPEMEPLRSDDPAQPLVSEESERVGLTDVQVEPEQPWQTEEPSQLDTEEHPAKPEEANLSDTPQEDEPEGVKPETQSSEPELVTEPVVQAAEQPEPETSLPQLEPKEPEAQPLESEPEKAHIEVQVEPEADGQSGGPGTSLPEAKPEKEQFNTDTKKENVEPQSTSTPGNAETQEAFNADDPTEISGDEAEHDAEESFVHNEDEEDEDEDTASEKSGKYGYLDGFKEGSICSWCKYCNNCKMCSKCYSCRRGGPGGDHCNACQYCKYCRLCDYVCVTACYPGSTLDIFTGAVYDALPNFTKMAKTAGEKVENAKDFIKEYL